MIEQDTVRLLRECDAGAKMGVDSLNDVIGRVKDSQFRDALESSREEHEALSDESMSEILSPLISYKGSAGEAAHFWIGHDNSFTTKALYRLGFKWPIINEDYLANAFEALDTLDFFSGE